MTRQEHELYDALDRARRSAGRLASRRRLSADDFGAQLAQYVGESLHTQRVMLTSSEAKRHMKVA
jgi:predicted NAD/FAD-dependent oxidoreductase